MQYIDKVAVNPELAIVFATVSAVALIACIVLWSWRGKDLWKPGLAAFIVTAICAGACVILGAPGTKDARNHQVDTFQKQVETTYGVTLRDEQVDRLEYPRQRPKGGTQSFGSIKQTASAEDGKFVRRELTLVWTGKKMVLAESTNGEDFTPLTTQK